MSDIHRIEGVEYVFSECIVCGIRYCVPRNMWNKQQEKGGFHYCQNGHRQGWSLEDSENARLRRERDRLKQRIAQRDDEIQRQKNLREMTERSLSATRGQVTKLRKRAASGVCPCCNRSFENLHRHMQTKHPDFGATEDAA